MTDLEIILLSVIEISFSLFAGVIIGINTKPKDRIR